MQLPSVSSSSQKRRDLSRSGSRLRKRHKRLDAICEDVYNENHGESNEGNGGAGPAGVDSELRRSSRVRRAPVLLDLSPSPVKKRRKNNKNVNLSGTRNAKIDLGSAMVGAREITADLEGSWSSRLRSRGRNPGYGGRVSTSRSLFFEVGGGREEGKVVRGELDFKERELDGGRLTGMRSKRLGRIKTINGGVNREKEADMSGVKDENDRDEVEVQEVKDKAEGVKEVLEIELGGRDEVDVVDGNDMQSVEVHEGKAPDSAQLEEWIGDDNVEKLEESDEQVEPELLECGKDRENAMNVEEDVGIATNEVDGGGNGDGEDNYLEKVDEKHVEVENIEKVKLNHVSVDMPGKSHIKQGRRCGLCGGGNDGKPPKRLTQDAGESEHEAYSGSSASEEPNYDVWDGFGDESGWLGRLLGPINDRYGIVGIWVHQHCAVWSPEVYFAGLGCLKNVKAALCRGRALKCTRCGRPGATIGCRVDRCPKTYHLPFARANGCIFDHRKFLIACTDHRRFFQPQGSQHTNMIKKLKAKKMKLEIRKLSNDVWRKDIEAEEKWLENCGEDEEFLKREGRRLHRDLLRIAPVYIGGTESESGKLFEGWESVAGLQDVIQCLKEVVILPLLYPQFFDNLGLTPPRGVLLHGYPGTGKTLVVRALIGSCARGDKRIAYFARKGADCLGKYVGDAERQLRLLFQVAERCQPSIIFFDEIDGLAPCRTRRQDQTHSSVVSTLLALLDGLKSRGSVVVIGATNRPEAVDPALRRPGRFDREIHFPLPCVKDRAAILSLHTQRWPKPVSGSLLKWIASRTVGFAGADLQALCTQAAIIALKRNFPLQEVLSAAGQRAPGAKRPPLPAFSVEESDWLGALSCSPPPCSRREAGIAAFDVVSSPLPTHLIPCLLQPLSTLLVSLYLDERLWLPHPLLKAATALKSVIISALDKKKLPGDHWWSEIDNFLQEVDVAKEVERSLSCAGILIGETRFAGSDFVDDTEDNTVKFQTSMMHSDGMRSSLFQNKFSVRKKSGFRILITGSPRSGQRHLASCLLHCFVGHVEIQKLDLATISQEGHGDLAQGITQILMKCASAGSNMVFMPRVDLWAVEACHQVTEENVLSADDQFSGEKGSSLRRSHVVQKESDSCTQQCKTEEMAELQGAARSASYAWSLFIEQVESICVSTSLMILATSEVPYPMLPHRIRQFFTSNVSDWCQSNPLEHAVPRFSVPVGDNFNRDTVINLSAVELSRDIIQLYVQLVHKKTHFCTSSWKEYNRCDSIGGDTDHPSGKGHEVKTQCPDDSSLKAPPPPNNRFWKGKSSLLLAISTFGYQILRYPHFAELCWVTSKLKEGPCADVNGIWKGWPFNSCIVRPSNSLDDVAVACGSSNMKSKEKFGLVRGLVAVGLSAYRGVYVSLREVSHEVRKVLELLVTQINSKIQSGRDRYQYVRILSQVAYLEDMVNYWAYALQSLNVDSQMKQVNPKLSTVEFPDNQLGLLDNPVRSEECEPNASNGTLHEPQGLVECVQGLATENLGCIDLNKGDADFGCLDTEGRYTVPEEGVDPKMGLLGLMTCYKLIHSSGDANQSVDENLNEQNGTSHGPSELERTGNFAVVDENSGSLKRSNGFAFAESVVHHENGCCSSGELDGVGIKLSDSRESSDQIKLSDPCLPTVDINLSSKITCLSAESGFECFYRCCSNCLFTLHSLLHKILIHEWELKGSSFMVEDAHDIVASLSVDLLSAVRKLEVPSKISSLSIEQLMHGNQGKSSESPGLTICGCKSSGNNIMPVECTCHSVDGCVTENGNTSPNSLVGLDPKFIIRDGVLVPVDSMKDVSFHCKFETLCLCSLTESIVTMKQPFD